MSAEEQLEPIRQALAADGYDLQVKAIGQGRLSLAVIATDGACVDCLVPKPVMAQIIQTAVGADLEIELQYPED